MVLSHYLTSGRNAFFCQLYPPTSSDLEDGLNGGGELNGGFKTVGREVVNKRSGRNSKRALASQNIGSMQCSSSLPQVRISILNEGRGAQPGKMHKITTILGILQMISLKCGDVTPLNAPLV